MKTMNACSARVQIQSAPTGIALNLKQVAVTTDEDIWPGFIQKAANSFCVPTGSSANVGHAKLQPLNLPMQGFSGFRTHAVVIDVAEYHPNVGVQLLHGVQNSEISNIAGMPYFVAIG